MSRFFDSDMAMNKADKTDKSFMEVFLPPKYCLINKITVHVVMVIPMGFRRSVLLAPYTCKPNPKGTCMFFYS